VEESVSALRLAHHISTSRLGRRRLALRTGLTEMTVRIELERMRSRGFIRLRRSGAELTTSGRRHFGPLLDPIRSVAEVELTSLRVGDISLAAHLARSKMGPVWTLRDEAVREGSTGLLLLRFGRDGWSFAHDDEPIRPDNPEDTRTIDTTFPEPSEGDLLLIASGPDLRSAGRGLWRVVLTILNDPS